MSLFETSMSTALMIVAALLLRSTLLNYVPKKTFLWLWYAVTARLLIPVGIVSPINIMKIFQTVITDTKTYSPVAFDSGLHIGYLSETTVIDAFHPMKYLTMIWIIGSVCVCGFFVLSQIIAKRHRKELISLAREEWIALWKGKSAPKGVRVFYGDIGVSPEVFGIFRPTIILPLQYMSLEEKARDALLYHELIHIRRHDNLFHAAMLAVVVIYWFSPFVWVMYFLALRDIEIACDEAVIHKMGRESKRFYADLLICVGSSSQSPLSLAKGFGVRAIKERLVSVMKYRNVGKISTVISIVLIIGISSVFATVPPQPVRDYNATVRPAESLLTQNSRIYQDDQIPLLVKTTIAGYTGAHTVPWEETVLYTRGTKNWKLVAGQSVRLFLNIAQKGEKSQLLIVGYLTEEHGEYIPMYFDYTRDDISLNFTVPEDGNYNFFIYANSSDSLSVNSFYIK